MVTIVMLILLTASTTVLGTANWTGSSTELLNSEWSSAECVDEEQMDFESVILRQIRSELESAMIAKGVKPERASATCLRRRFVLNATDAKSCRSSVSKGLRCFVVPKSVQAHEVRLTLGVQKHVDAFDVFTQRLLITEYYSTATGNTATVEHELHLNNESKKTGWFYAELRGLSLASRPSNDSYASFILPEKVSVRCPTCAYNAAVDRTASLEVELVTENSSDLLVRRKRQVNSVSTSAHSRVNPNTRECKKYERSIDLRKILSNVVFPDGNVVYSFCAGFCSAQSSMRHVMTRAFVGRLFSCCAPTGFEQQRVTVNTGGNYTSFELPLRVPACTCD